jgi:hypothetical protein
MFQWFPKTWISNLRMHRYFRDTIPLRVKTRKFWLWILNTKVWFIVKTEPVFCKKKKSVTVNQGTEPVNWLAELFGSVYVRQLRFCLVFLNCKNSSVRFLCSFGFKPNHAHSYIYVHVCVYKDIIYDMIIWITNIRKLSNK